MTLLQLCLPTVVMIQDLPSSVDQSWCHGEPYVYIEITVTEPSSAIQNLVEIKRALVKTFGTIENIPQIMITLMTVLRIVQISYR